MADPARRFTGRVEAYAAHRPSYPEGVLRILEEECALTPATLVADVGSGTGKLTELLLERGARVFAVEPNAEMRAAAEALLGKYPLFTSVAGRAEDTTLPAQSVDLVTAAQAFHWFDVARARVELARILRAPGPIALVWNQRDVASTAFLREYEKLLLERGTDYNPGSHGRASPAALAQFFGAAGFRMRSVPNLHPTDLEGLRGRVFSSSYVPLEDSDAGRALAHELAELFARHESNGVVTFVYETQVYWGTISG